MATPNIAPTTPGAVTLNHDAVGSLQHLIRDRGGAPILRNPAFANVSTRDPANRALAQSTFGGRFAHAGHGADDDRHRHRFGRVIGFLGPIFWPYAYDDFFDYTFSPYAYDTFWPYAYDDVINGIYGAYAPGYSDYATDAAGYATNSDAPAGETTYVYGNATDVGVMRGGRPLAAAPRGAATQICSEQTEGLTDFPIARIAQQVKPDQAQQALLDALKAATEQALDVLRAACPSDLPSTPTGRLAAQRDRVAAMLQAVRVIEPALQNFYGSLSDEQKERFNALDADTLAMAENRQPDSAQQCGGEPQAANLPIATIEQLLRLNDAQQTSLNAVKEASLKARGILKANCPSEPTFTPTARLAHMTQRLEAMMQVLDTVQPTLASFYGSLDDEQKARFNRFSARAP